MIADRRRRHPLLLVGLPLVVAAAIAGLSAAHVLSGPVAIVVAAAAALALPVAPRLSQRVAVVGSVAAGAVPLLWWIPLPAVIAGLRVPVVLGVVAGALIAIGLTRGCRRLVPAVSANDIVVGASAAVATAFFAPVLLLSPAGSLRGLIIGFGNDNVAHFDMFEMIRRTGSFGPWWQAGENGIDFAYGYYPQHFHVLAAAVADLLGPSRLGDHAAEAQAYFSATAVVLIGVVVVIVAAVASLSELRRRTGFVAVVAAATVSSIILGFGGWSLVYGFPGFLLAVGACVTAIVLATEGRRHSMAALAAAGAAVVVAAHSWSLLTPIAGVAFVTMLWPYWLTRRKRRRRATGALVITAAMAGGVLFALYLVVAVTRGAGSAADALATPGGVIAFPLPICVALILLTIVASLALTSSARGVRRLSSAAPGIAGFVALGALGALIVVQLAAASRLGYFQYKYTNGIALIALVILPLTITLVLSRWSGGSWEGIRRPVRAIMAATASVATLLFFGLPFGIGAGIPTRAPGAAFVGGVTASAAAPSDAVDRISAAATVMAQWPCPRPVYVADPDDIDDVPVVDAQLSNLWAMALSGTWTNNAGSVTPYLFVNQQALVDGQVDAVVSGLLAEDPTRCAIIGQTSRAAIDDAVTERFGDRLVVVP